MGSGESERESLLIHETTPKYFRQKSIHGQQEPGGKHTRRHHKWPQFAHVTFSPANYFFAEDASASGAAKTINGNNNFELTEFDTKAPTYR